MTAYWHERQKDIEAGLLSVQAFVKEVGQFITAEVSRIKRNAGICQTVIKNRHFILPKPINRETTTWEYLWNN